MKHVSQRYSSRTIAPQRPVLPPADTVRWVARRKAEVVAAVESGHLSMREACLRYRLSHAEFLEWERHYKTNGLAGLKISSIRLH